MDEIENHRYSWDIGYRHGVVDGIKFGENLSRFDILDILNALQRMKREELMTFVQAMLEKSKRKKYE